MEVLGIPHSLFEEKLEKLKNAKGVKLDTELTALDLKELVEQYKNVYLETKGENFPSGTKYITDFFTFPSFHRKIFKLIKKRVHRTIWLRLSYISILGCA